MIRFIVTAFLCAVFTHGQEDVVTTQSLDPMADEATYYIGELFEKYGVDGKMSFEGFEHLMVSLGLGKMRISDHDLSDHFDDYGEFLALHQNHDHKMGKHGHQHDQDEHSNQNKEHPSAHEDPSSDNEEHSNDHDHEEQLSNNHEKEHSNDHHHEEEHSNDHHHEEEHSNDHHHEEEHSNDSDENTSQTPERRKRALTSLVTVTHDHVHNKCLTARDILTNYRLDPVSAAIEPGYFMQLCPAIIYQLDQKFCGRNATIKPKSHEAKAFWHISPAAWGWAFLAVTIISLVGLASVAVIPIMDKVFYNHLLQFLVALAIGTLTGDALLHLLPHAISPGGHDETAEEGHGHDLDPIWKGAVILAGIYTFFMVERLMAMMTQWKRQRKETQTQKEMKVFVQTSNTLYDNAEVGEKLCHHDNEIGSETCRDVMVHSQKDIRDDAEESQVELDSGDCEEGSMLSKCEEHVDDLRSHHHGHFHEVPGDVSSVAWMVIMGDGLHNFTDGLAIGAAFADNISVGLSTTLAVFCHELPHELGDFAVLLRAGMQVKQALVYNIVSSVLCVIGMVGGLLLGNLEAAHGWIYALTAGIFIYISLVDMLPEITSMKSQKGESACCHLLLQMLGISLGVGIMLIIAIYEDSIRISIGN